jgi:DNA repair photolyase
MTVLYEPQGRAREYSELACNLYRGCVHGCKYCFAPACMHTTPSDWHSKVEPRLDVLKKLDKDAEKMQGDSRRILFSFTSDPYQPLERKAHLTRQALQIIGKYNLKSQVLTKGHADIIADDLPLMRQIGTELGITLCFVDDTLRQEWEPEAASVEERLSILKAAHQAGIFTWVSLEPVIDPEQALDVIRIASPFVRFWKVGKLNHNKAVEASIDWKQFLTDVELLLSKLKAKYYIKDDLRRFGAI